MGGISGEVERRFRNVREALERNNLDAAVVAGSEYTGFEGAVTYLSGFVIVHRYAYVLLPLDGEPTVVFPAEARYVGEHGTTWIEEQVFVETPGAWLRERASERGWNAARRLRARLRHARARLPGAGGRRAGARLLRRRLRPRARGEERGGNRLGARERPDQHGGLLDLPGGVRGREERGRAPGALRALLRRAGLRSADDGHGPRGRGRRRGARVPHRQPRAAHSCGRPRPALARDRGPRRALGRGLSRDRRRRAGRRGQAHAGGRTRSTSRWPARPCGPAPRRTTCTGPSHGASPSAATSSAMSPATRSG